MTVTEGPTTKVLSGGGQLVITNSGELSAVLSSIAVLLERSNPGNGDAPGPSGGNWEVLSSAIAVESPACEMLGEARTCYGTLLQAAGASLVLFDPDTNDVIALNDVLPIPATLDNDMDGLRDEDPPLPSDFSKITGGCSVIDNDGDGLLDEDPLDGIDNDMDGLIDEDDPDDDGDGLVDEDDACTDAVVINFAYEFDITAFGIEGPGDGIVPSADDLRIDLVATFGSAGRRGGSGASCSVDANCNGLIDDDDPSTPLVDEGEKNNIRSIQQRLRFDPVGCAPVCDMVTLTDAGAMADDPTCVSVTSSTLMEVIAATEVPGAQSLFSVTGTVSCTFSTDFCMTNVCNTAELTCDDNTLISGSPASACFSAECNAGDDGGNGNPAPGDFCTQTQGGWGQDSCNPDGITCGEVLNGQGGNVACFRDCIFDFLFPMGLVVGDPDGPDADGSYAILLTNSQAVADYLPTGGTPSALTADQTDPLVTSSGVFGGQLVAATLNVAVDDAGLRRDGGIQPFPAGTLKTLVYVDGCVADALVGLSVSDVIALSNVAISGGGTPMGVTISDLSDALAALNENFVDCDTALGCLTFP